VRLYNRIQRTGTVVHKIFYAAVELLSYLNRRDVTFGAGYYLAVLKEYRPHLVFSVHDCLNRGYFQLARQTLGGGPGSLRHLLRRVFRWLGLLAH